MISYEYYSDVATADAYFDSLLFEVNWPAASAADKPKALLAATRLVDSFRYQGTKTDSDQDLEFPRCGATEVPEEILIAVFEIASSILGGFDPAVAAASTETGNIASVTYAEVGIKYHSPSSSTVTETSVPEYKQLGLPSKQVYDMLAKFFAETEYSTFRMDRVS